MDHLSSCYFCGTALDDPLRAYLVDSETAGSTTVTLCPTCRRKLDTVLDAADAGSLAAEGQVRDAPGPPEPDDEPTTATDAADPPGGDGASTDERPGHAGGEPTPAIERAEDTDETSEYENEKPRYDTGKTNSSTSSVDTEGENPKENSETGERAGGMPERAEETESDEHVSAAGDVDEADGMDETDEDDGMDEADGTDKSDEVDEPDGNAAAEPAESGGPESGDGTTERRESGDDGGSPGSDDTDGLRAEMEPDIPEELVTDSVAEEVLEGSDGRSEPEADAEPPGESGADDETPDFDEMPDPPPSESADASPTEDIRPRARISALEYNKVMRLLQNREFPVDRAEIESVAASAYDLAESDCAEVIDLAVDRGLLAEEDGELLRPE